MGIIPSGSAPIPLLLGLLSMFRQFAFAAALIVFSCSFVLAAEPELNKRYTEAIERDPTNSKPYIDRGKALLYTGHFDKAIKDFTVAITLAPKNAEHYAFRGDALVVEGNFDDAIHDYTQAITLSPPKGTAYHDILYNLRGNAWANKGEFDNAIKDYTESIRLFPKKPLSYNHVAWLRATCPNERYRDGKNAVADATTACELSEWQVGGCIDTLAAAYAETGDFATAIKWQEKAIELTKTEKQEMQEHLELYKAGKPFREKPKK